MVYEVQTADVDQDLHSSNLWLVGADAGTPKQLSSHDGASQPLSSRERQIALVSGSATAERVAFAWTDLHRSGYISIVDWRGEHERAVVDINESWAEDRRWPVSTFRSFQSASGERNQGRLLLPREQGPY